MIAQIFQMSGMDKRVIEPVIKDENMHYMHMVLLPGEVLPVHITNATVYMTVVRGTLSIRLADEEEQKVCERSVLRIPQGIEMDAQNHEDETLELFVVKVPAPK